METRMESWRRKRNRRVRQRGATAPSRRHRRSGSSGSCAELGTEHGTIGRVARQLGYGEESVRSWVRQADIDEGEKPGVTSEQAERIKALEQENKELKRANEILRRASAYFAQAELDRPLR